jgi:hypothetical protein
LDGFLARVVQDDIKFSAFNRNALHAASLHLFNKGFDIDDFWLWLSIHARKTNSEQHENTKKNNAVTNTSVSSHGSESSE